MIYGMAWSVTWHRIAWDGVETAVRIAVNRCQLEVVAGWPDTKRPGSVIQVQNLDIENRLFHRFLGDPSLDFSFTFWAFNTDTTEHPRYALVQTFKLLATAGTRDS
jgi:hypothetical protein